jgi:hypothetical protein
MGQEALCLARIGERVVQVTALLETDELILRGEYRARLPFAGIEAVEATDGYLTLYRAGEPIVLELGAAAERWAAKIRNPPTLLDKLGVKPGQRVAVVGLRDMGLRAQLGERAEVYESMGVAAASFAHDVVGAEFDLAFLQIDDLAVLRAALPVLRESIAQAGAVWVIHPKRRPDLKDTDVMAAGRAAGLVDNKTARISESHTGLRFVIPKASRRPAAPSRQQAQTEHTR